MSIGKTMRALNVKKYHALSHSDNRPKLLNDLPGFSTLSPGELRGISGGEAAHLKPMFGTLFVWRIRCATDPNSAPCN
jgi:hypothetical protein